MKRIEKLRALAKEATVKVLASFQSSQFGRCKVIEDGRYAADGTVRLRVVKDGTDLDEAFFDGSSIAVLTVCVSPKPVIQEGVYRIKTWSENAEIAKDLLAQGIFTDTQFRIRTGHVEASVWRLNPTR